MAWALLLVVFFEHIKKSFSAINNRVPIFLNPLCHVAVGPELAPELEPLPSIAPLELSLSATSIELPQTPSKNLRKKFDHEDTNQPSLYIM